jgi:hypothetical protein
MSPSCRAKDGKGKFTAEATTKTNKYKWTNKQHRNSLKERIDHSFYFLSLTILCVFAVHYKKDGIRNPIAMASLPVTS